MRSSPERERAPSAFRLQHMHDHMHELAASLSLANSNAAIALLLEHCLLSVWTKVCGCCASEDGCMIVCVCVCARVRALCVCVCCVHSSHLHSCPAIPILFYNI